MSSVILDNWTVYYAGDGAGNGHKQIRWTGAGGPETDTNTVNELYSALADLFSIPAQNNADDTIPIRAVTPTVYEIGAFDAGDLEPWFIDPESIKHLTGGSLQSVGWERDPLPADGTGDIGILMVQCSGTGFNIDSGDVGDSCTHASGDTGTILYVDTINYRIWIRPTDNTLANDFNTGSGNITADTSTNTAAQTANGVTGERLWSNVYSIGTIEDNTRIYVVQNFTNLTNFWGDGHIDRLYLVNDGFDAGLIDDGLLTIYSRQYTKLYDHFQADVSTGGRNPIPLATSADINNTTGIRTFTGSGGNSNTFDEGNYIYVGATWATATKKGVLTAAATGAAPVIIYYLVGDITQDFAASDAVKEYDPATGADGDATTTASAPSDYGPALVAGVTITFGATQQDIGDGEDNQPYDVLIDLGSGSLHLDDFYEYTKYITRQGNTDDIDASSQTRPGQQYTTTGEYRLSYTGQTANFTEGATLTGQTSGATGVITADHDGGTTGTLIVRDVRGTFDNTNGEEIRDNVNPGIANLPAGGVSTTLVVKTSPFGTFAGNTFFGARGVWIQDMHADDANNYQLTDSNNVVRTPPASISIAVNNLVSGDKVGVFQASDANGTINKSMYTIYETHTAPVGYIRITGSATLDTPSSGAIRVVRKDGSTIIGEERYTYSAWVDNTTYTEFTLTGGNTTQNYDTSDTVYVPYLDQQATGSSVSTSVQYVSDQFVITTVRRKGILPFSIFGTNQQITTAGYTATAIKTFDSIVD